MWMKPTLSAAVMLFNMYLAVFLYQWLKLTADDVKEQIYKLAKKGLTPSQIGQCKMHHVIFMQKSKRGI